MYPFRVILDYRRNLSWCSEVFHVVSVMPDSLLLAGSSKAGHWFSEQGGLCYCCIFIVIDLFTYLSMHVTCASQLQALG